MNDDQRRHLAQICNRPGMYVASNDFEQVCAYIDGLHAATGCLIGFREWLIVELGTGNNLVWWGLVRQVFQRDSTPSEEHAQRLGELIDEFYKFTGSTIGATSGLMRVYVRYHGWLLSQKWYKPEWIDYVPPCDQKSENAE